MCWRGYKFPLGRYYKEYKSSYQKPTKMKNVVLATKLFILIEVNSKQWVKLLLLLLFIGNSLLINLIILYMIHAYNSEVHVDSRYLSVLNVLVIITKKLRFTRTYKSYTYKPIVKIVLLQFLIHLILKINWSIITAGPPYLQLDEPTRCTE